MNTVYDDPVYFVDEGDIVVRARMMSISKESYDLIGLVSLIQNKVFLFTATLSEYLKDLIEQCVKDVQIHSHPAARCIINDVSDNCDYSGESFDH